MLGYYVSLDIKYYVTDVLNMTLLSVSLFQTCTCLRLSRFDKNIRKYIIVSYWQRAIL